ncbi:MAG: RsmE family RNA methyltransferase [Planctomycetes bacterium]|nr:RsmE family RNA methyltransferase [Planctomycetota bacterium]
MAGLSKDKGRWVGRYFVEDLPGGDGRFELRGREAKHAAASRRAGVGDVITLFDGSGWDVESRVVEVLRDHLVLDCRARKNAGAPLQVPLTCAAALPKGSREDVLVARCAELGVARFVPVEFARSTPRVRCNRSARHRRFERLAIGAAKQSGASTLMEIAEPVGLAEFLGAHSRGLGLVGSPESGVGIIETLESRWPFDEAVFLVGPEGGLTAPEYEAAAAAGFAECRLGPTTLRVETACIAFAAVSVAFLAQH